MSLAFVKSTSSLFKNLKERKEAKLESVSPPPPSALGEFDDSSEKKADGWRNLHSEPRWAGAVRAANNADAFELDVASEPGRESE